MSRLTLSSRICAPKSGHQGKPRTGHQTHGAGAWMMAPSFSVTTWWPSNPLTFGRCCAARQMSVTSPSSSKTTRRFLKRFSPGQLQRKGPLLQDLLLSRTKSASNPPQRIHHVGLHRLGDGMDKLDVSLRADSFCCVCLHLPRRPDLPLWEKDFRDFDPYYFCFITLTTIGFGDIIPKHPKYFMLISLFIIVGMAIMSMAFKLSQTRIVNFYRKCIKLITRGNYEVFNNKDKKLDDS
ncbi:Potassium channel subfamily K member 18 [Oryzias melastigma]|uniref:Potassium channel subfamily K member 18 n=1 Tax=Oryzias melastigma TaxID=30732 RepID=A0A834BYX5_ORYME|nr:Potassium channel subfamily K member 18 [Oryzias melastigma]